MKKFFRAMAAVFTLVAVVVISVNYQFQVQYWLFATKNESPVELLSMLFIFGLLTGGFLALSFVVKKIDAGDDDF